MIEKLNFEQTTCLIGIITGIIWMLISLVVQNNISRQMDLKVKNQYSNETIEYIISFPLWGKLFTQFCSGLVFGSFILPFFLFENVQQIKIFTTGNLFIAIIYCIWATLFFISLCSHKIYLTNKRILSEQSLKPLINLKLYNFLFDDIKTIDYQKNNLLITLNNDEKFDTGMKPNLKDFYEKFIILYKNQ